MRVSSMIVGLLGVGLLASPVAAQSTPTQETAVPPAPSLAICEAFNLMSGDEADAFLRGYITGVHDGEVGGELGYELGTEDPVNNTMASSEADTATDAATGAGIVPETNANMEIDRAAVLAACRADPTITIRDAITQTTASVQP